MRQVLHSCIPGIASIAVGIVTALVYPSPIGIKDNLPVDGSAFAWSGASLPGQGRVSLGLISTDALGVDRREDRKEGSSRLEHFERKIRR